MPDAEPSARTWSPSRVRSGRSKGRPSMRRRSTALARPSALASGSQFWNLRMASGRWPGRRRPAHWPSTLGPSAASGPLPVQSTVTSRAPESSASYWSTTERRPAMRSVARALVGASVTEHPPQHVERDEPEAAAADRDGDRHDARDRGCLEALGESGGGRRERRAESERQAARRIHVSVGIGPAPCNVPAPRFLGSGNATAPHAASSRLGGCPSAFRITSP